MLISIEHAQIRSIKHGIEHLKKGLDLNILGPGMVAS